MRTLDDINNEIIALRKIVPDSAMEARATIGTLGDIEVAYNYATSAGKALPTGGKLVAIFNDTCPTGWTRVTAWDDKFIRGAATYGGTGGSSSTHTHTCDAVVAHTHGAGTLATASDGAHTHSYTLMSGTGAGQTGSGKTGVHRKTGGATTGSGGSHSHVIGGHTAYYGDASYSSGASSMLPPYIEVIFCSKD